MHGYDANVSPAAEYWLPLDEFHRITQVEDYHRSLEEPVGDHSSDQERLHATAHVLVENRILEHEHLTVNAMHRLIRQGLSRHEAIDAIGAVLIEEVFEILKTGNGKKASQRCHHRLEKLTAERWQQGHW